VVKTVYYTNVELEVILLYPHIKVSVLLVQSVATQMKVSLARYSSS